MNEWPLIDLVTISKTNEWPGSYNFLDPKWMKNYCICFVLFHSYIVCTMIGTRIGQQNTNTTSKSKAGYNFMDEVFSGTNGFQHPQQNVKTFCSKMPLLRTPKAYPIIIFPQKKLSFSENANFKKRLA